MADLILSPVVEYLFEKLTSKAEDAINLYLQKKEKIKELPKTIQKWKKQLRDIAKVLSDAEQKRSEDESIEEWLKDLQDWAYDLEDLLDEFATDARLNECYPELHEEEDDSPPFCKCFPCSKVLSVLPCVSRASDLNNDAYVTRIEEISNRLDAILRRVETLGLVKQKPSREERQQEQRIETTCIAPRVFGRTREKQLIINRLLVDESYNEGNVNYAVIPIVGKGAVGKTTLIQSVYNDEKLEGRFGVKAWVCVSDVFDIKHITTSIIKSADPENCSSATFDNLNEAQTKLCEILREKRFLIALDDVWNDKYNPWEQLQLPFLKGLEGSIVLVTTRDDNVAKNMLTTRDQNSIVHVDGLSNEECWLIFKEHALISDDPVVIETRDEVIKLCKGLPLAAKALGGLLKKNDRSKWSRILRSGMWSEEGGVLPALRLSYYHLPQHLKRVFAYCSVFPQDHNFDKNEIVLMWMAEGFLPESEEESMEDKGNSYFDDLVSRSLLEPISSYLEGKFIMHDLINDLAHWAAGDVCCRMKIKKKIPSRTRYLSVTEVSNQDPSFLENFGDAGRQLRSYVHLSGSLLQSTVLESSPWQFQCLRVLFLVDMGFTKLPDSIGNLKHLRFLDLSYNEELEHLPESMSKLCNLQTLVLYKCKKIKKLFDMAFLIELRHLNIALAGLLEMPLEIGKFTNLRTLIHYNLSANSGVNSGPRIRELELKNLKYLSSFNKMVEIDMKYCSRCESLPPLGQLPSLKHLHLENLAGIKTVGPEFYGTGFSKAFPTLKTLSFSDMKNWEVWCTPPSAPSDENSRSFPFLEEIYISDCPLLQGNIPSYLPSLKILEIKDTPEIKVALPSCPLLQELKISGGCRELSSIKYLPSVKYLRIDRDEFLNDVFTVTKPFTCLECLDIRFCKALRITANNYLPLTLRKLILFGVEIEQPAKEWGLDRLLTSLEHLEIECLYWIDSCLDAVELIPDDLPLPSSLVTIHIWGFKNLKSFSCSTLHNLSELGIYKCPLPVLVEAAKGRMD